MSFKTLTFTMQLQLLSQWCWAAVAASVKRYYKPADRTTQCKVANLVLVPTVATYGTTTCCTSKSVCNETAALDLALSKVACLNAVWLASDFQFDGAKRQIDAGKPVGARVEYFDATGHFVAIVGYYDEPAYRATHVKDPYLGDTVIVGDGTAGYDGGVWTHFYTTRTP